jgi:hypothetical protein
MIIGSLDHEIYRTHPLKYQNAKNKKIKKLAYFQREIKHKKP